MLPQMMPLPWLFVFFYLFFCFYYIFTYFSTFILDSNKFLKFMSISFLPMHW